MELAEALDVIAKLGELMQREPLAIHDTKRLPVSKEEMKVALKLLWSTLKSQDQRHHVEIAYITLANFQDGVGDAAISPSLPPDCTPEQATELLGPYLKWAGKLKAEGEVLLSELADLKLQVSGAKI